MNSTGWTHIVFSRPSNSCCVTPPSSHPLPNLARLQLRRLLLPPGYPCTTSPCTAVTSRRQPPCPCHPPSPPPGSPEPPSRTHRPPRRRRAAAAGRGSPAPRPGPAGGRRGRGHTPWRRRPTRNRSAPPSRTAPAGRLRGARTAPSAPLLLLLLLLLLILLLLLLLLRRVPTWPLKAGPPPPEDIRGSARLRAPARERQQRWG